MFNLKELLIKERISSLWEQILSFQRSSHLKRDTIEENHCLIQKSPFNVHSLFQRSGYTSAADNPCKLFGSRSDSTKMLGNCLTPDGILKEFFRRK